MNRMRARRILHENQALKARLASAPSHVEPPKECERCKELEAELVLLREQLKDARRYKGGRGRKKPADEETVENSDETED